MAKTKSPALSTETLRPYVQRAMTDPELREDLLAAFVAARGIYDQMSRGRGIKGKAEKVSEKDFQKQLQHLVEDLSEASDKLKGKAKSHKARNRILLLTGGTLGVLYNPWTGEQTREWIMDRVAGGDGAGLEELETLLNVDFLPEERDEETDTLGGAYDESGRRDPKWDGPARERSSRAFRKRP